MNHLTLQNIDGALNIIGQVYVENDSSDKLATCNFVNNTITSELSLKADLASPTFSGTVGGITSTMVGLGNVNNTSDANKPISSATQTALDLKADITYVDSLGGGGLTVYDQVLDISNLALFTSDTYKLMFHFNSIPAGTYMLVGTVGLALNSTLTQAQLLLSNSQFTFGPRTTYCVYNNTSTSTSAIGNTHSLVLNGIFTLTSTTTLYLMGVFTFSGGVGTLKMQTDSPLTQLKLMKLA